MNKRRVAILLAVTAVGMVLAYALALFPTPETQTRSVREALLDELRTVTLKNCTLKRYGSAYDGGYLMCENLIDGVQAAYSYGIDTEDNWGCDVSRQFNVVVHQYDCFTPHRPTCEGGKFVFHDECVGASAERVDGQPFDTFASQIARNGDAGKSLLVKIDIEGGFVAGDAGCGARQDLTDADGASRQRPGEVSRGRAALEAPVLSREPSFQQLGVRARRRAIPRVGVPGAMGQQADRST
jgi:hypothetical protein